MRALIVVESWFGNTRAARAVADGLGEFMTVEVCEVGDAPARLAPDVELVVVGGPTHAFGMSRPNTRRDAAQQAGVTTGTERGIREWLASSHHRSAVVPRHGDVGSAGAPGELDRARQWGGQLGTAITAMTATDRGGWAPTR
jgi:hypothetical protein